MIREERKGGQDEQEAMVDHHVDHHHRPGVVPVVKDLYHRIATELIMDAISYDELDCHHQELRDRIAHELREAHVRGLRQFAWWKDGTEYVGTCGTTLKKATEEVRGGETKTP